MTQPDEQSYESLILRRCEYSDLKYEKLIKYECEAWADWNKLDEDEQDETVNGYNHIARKENARLMPVIRELLDLIKQRQYLCPCDNKNCKACIEESERLNKLGKAE